MYIPPKEPEPPGDAKAMQLQTTEAYFDALAHDWDEQTSRSPRFQARYREFARLIAEYATPRSRALDYGCGSGALCQTLSRLAGSVVGTDISHEMLELATKKLADHPNVRIAELEDVPRYSFDLALCSSVIEYAEDDELFLKNVASYVAPRGYLIITFPNRTGVLQLMQRYLMSRFHPDSYIHFQKNTYTDRSIRVLLERAGLQALQLYAPIGFPGLRRIGLGELLLCVARKPA